MMETLRNVSALIFGAGLLLMGIDALLFLLDWSHAGVVFCLGLGACAVSALMAERAKTEDVIVLLVAAAVLGLVAIRSL